MCKDKKSNSGVQQTKAVEEIEVLKKKFKALKEEVEEREKKIDEYIDHIQRLQADFENYKKQKEKQEIELIQNANERLILKLLDVYEDLERALQNCSSTEELRGGLEIIHRKFKDTLEKEGLSEIPAEGEKFDPFRHEAVMVENHDEYEDGFIIEELAKGYMLNNRIIKHSIVKVCKKS